MRSFDFLVGREKLSAFTFAILAACCLVLSQSIQPVFAQTITGAVRGVVTDPSEAVIADARVTATNTATSVVSSTVTDRSGLYNFPFLPIGTYVIAASASGFDTTSVAPFKLEIDQVASINVKLQVG